MNVCCEQALGDFVALSGPVPIKPFRTHGVWHSREMPMTEAIMHQVVQDYQTHSLPLNMFVLDVRI
jgi:alpha-glucosidase (family GH31 glycosyl hydrolase)